MSASIYDPKTKTLVPFAGTSISMMSELSDVELSAPSDGQVLSYDATSQAWENADTVNEVTVTQVVSSGTKIATIAVDGTSTDLYAPAGGGGGGTSDYSDLSNKPQIEGVTLSGNKTASDLGLAKSTDIPTALADLSEDTTHRLVTDTEKSAWNDKSEVSVTQVLSSGTKIASVTVDGAATDLYAPEGGGGHTIEDSESTSLTQRDTLQFGEGLLAEDDSTNEKTIISPDVMQSGDMDDVITPLPSVAPKKEGIKYSTTEQVIGEWIDGKPIYQKTINYGALPNTTTKDVAHGILNIDTIINYVGCTSDSTGTALILPFVNVTGTVNQIQISATKSNVRIVTGIDRSSFNRTYITLQYTKTTDTPNT